MQFAYVVYASDRRIVKGTISAPSEGIAAQVLSRSGYRVLSLKPSARSMPALDKLFPSLFKTKPQTVVTFSRQLALLLESGTDIVSALELLQAQSADRGMERMLVQVIADLRNGERLSTALAKHPTVFPKLYVQSLIVGEQSGGLEGVLRQVAAYLEKDAKAAQSVKGALKYPIMVSVIALIVVAVMVVFVFPAFASLYTSLGADLPLTTRLVLSTVKGLTKYGPYGLFAVAAVAVVVMAYMRTSAGRLRWDGWMLKLPLLGRVIHLSELARCCRSISLLFRAGLPLPQIMLLAVDGSGNVVMKGALDNVRQAMINGEGLSGPMARSPLFLPMMVQMVGVGQATGNLDTTLSATADCYEAEAEDRTKSLIGMIQPAMTIFIGLVVGLIALSLVSAMYSVYGQ